MKLKEVAKIGVIVSILLFCLAVGSFEFIRLTDTDKSHEFDLYSLVPNDCIALLESDNLNFFISDYEEISFLKELHNFQNASISHLFFHRLMESNTENKHGISNLISRILISYNPTMSDDGEVLYVRTNNEGKRFIEYILENDSNKRISPKKEKYRKKNILIYPLLNGQFLATFKDDGFYVMSFQKNLIEQVIDTYSDMDGIDQDEILRQARENKKAHNYLTLYSRFSFMPMLNEECRRWRGRGTDPPGSTRRGSGHGPGWAPRKTPCPSETALRHRCGSPPRRRRRPQRPSESPGPLHAAFSARPG